jgi:hypothetical protein
MLLLQKATTTGWRSEWRTSNDGSKYLKPGNTEPTAQKKAIISINWRGQFSVLEKPDQPVAFRMASNS